MSSDTPDFSELHQRFNGLPMGARAELRRAAAPDDLRDMPGLYRLFPNSRPSDRQVRMAFLLPWCKEVDNRQNLRGLCARTRRSRRHGSFRSPAPAHPMTSLA